VGEVGLDYFRLPEEGAEEVKKRQKEAFRAQIELAGAKKLPVIVHCRDAYEDCLEIISRFPRQKFLMHCYMASPTVTEKFLSLPEVFFSFAGNLTYPKDVQAPILRSAEMIPSGRVLVETDSPYLCPQPKRGRRNDPRNLPLIIQTLASLRGESREEVAAFTTAAATEFFALPKLSS
ncbi:MAG TPA: TatD family deoxyribonuclease, partial [Candidatus Moranbacteria bacterium]|nr:TatD family deoxyribonuclease [Candidatus Moranbacteria bacterium]